MAVYLEGFDGHCLRAQAYFPESMPDIQRAPPETTCYKASVGGTDVYFHADEDVEYLGQQMKGRDLYKLLACKGVKGET